MTGHSEDTSPIAVSTQRPVAWPSAALRVAGQLQLVTRASECSMRPPWRVPAGRSSATYERLLLERRQAQRAKLRNRLGRDFADAVLESLLIRGVRNEGDTAFVSCDPDGLTDQPFKSLEFWPAAEIVARQSAGGDDYDRGAGLERCVDHRWPCALRVDRETT